MRNGAVAVEELRDIHLPPDLHWFQLSPSGWATLLVCLAAASMVLIRWQRRRRAADPVLQARLQLDKGFRQWQQDGDKAAYLHLAATTLKLLAVRRGQRRSTARLTGAEWVYWLNQQGYHQEYQVKGKSGSRDNRQSLGVAGERAMSMELYQQNPQTNIVELHQALGRWLQPNNKTANA